jgi:hypothetical protein
VKAATWLAVAALSASLAAPAQEQQRPPPARLILPETGVTVRMGDFGGRPVIDLMINGRGPYPAILDTGASLTVIDTELSAQLKLPKAAGVEVAPEGNSEVPLVTIRELGIGSAKCRNFTAAAMPMFFKKADAPKIVLSAEAFHGYLMTLDFPARRVSLRKGSLPAADERGVFAFAAVDAIPTIPVKVGSVERRVHLDTGSPQGLTLPTEYMTKVALTSEAREAGMARTHGGDFKIYKAGLSEAVYVGALKLVLPEIIFSDVRPGGGPPGPPPGNLGSKALQDLVLTIDAAHGRLRLARP